MLKRIGAVCAVLCLAICAAAFPRQEAPDLVRLHVIAKSNSLADQSQKLVVRDAVLETSRELLSDAKDYAQAYAILDERIDDIAKAADMASGGAGVSASLTVEAYPERDYGAFTLPAGEYHSLKIEIGEGEGRNWWCVVYPSLCYSQTTDAAQIDEILAKKPLRSLIGEWAQSVWTRIFDREDEKYV